MGEIIIKVPENVREVVDLEVPYSRVKEKIRELYEDEKLKREFFSLKLPKETKAKTIEDTKSDYYEGILEING